MKIRSKQTFVASKGDTFHLDQWLELMHNTTDLFHNVDEEGESNDISDTCKADKSFEVTVIIKTN